MTSVLVVGVLTLAACGDDDNGKTAESATSTSASASTNASTSKAVRAAWIVDTIATYQEAQEVGVKKALADDGGTVKVFSGNFDPQKSLAACKDAITTGRYNVILLYTAPPPAGVPCVQAAKQAGIPVVGASQTIGTDPNDLEPQVDGVVGGAYYTPNGNSKVMVALAKEACKGLDPCNIIGEVSTPNDGLTNQVIADVAKQVPNAKIVAKVQTAYDPTQIATKLPDILTAHKDANVFLSIADSQALAAVPVAKAAGMSDQLKLLGSGGSREGAKAVKSGEIFGTSGSWPEQEGVILGDMLIKAVNGQEINPKGVELSTIDTPSVLYKDNIDQFTAEWGSE